MKLELELKECKHEQYIAKVSEDIDGNTISCNVCIACGKAMSFWKVSSSIETSDTDFTSIASFKIFHTKESETQDGNHQQESNEDT